MLHNTVVSLFSRCTCGNCNVEILQNAKECHCCQEIENCIEFIKSFDHEEFVTGGQGDKLEGTLNCITDHPGFDAVCLNKWSLELAAANFKTRDGHTCCILYMSISDYVCEMYLQRINLPLPRNISIFISVTFTFSFNAT